MNPPSNQPQPIDRHHQARGMNRRAIVLIGTVIVTICAAVISFSGLYELAIRCGYHPWLAVLYPVIIDAAAGFSGAAWLTNRATTLARRLTLSFVLLSVILNSTLHVLVAYQMETPWWLVVLVGSMPPITLGAVLHLDYRVQEDIRASQLPALVTDLEAVEEATGVPAASLSDRPTVLYRLWDANEELLYVGVTSTPLQSRLARHRRIQEWWDEVANVTVEEFPQRTEALAAEMKAIGSENPRYNKSPGSLVDAVTKRAARVVRPVEDRPAPVASGSLVTGDLEDRARLLVAGGGGRGTLMKELDLTEHQARALLDRVRQETATNGKVVA